MRRPMSAVALALVAVLGVSACSGSSTHPAAPSSTSTDTVHNAAVTGSSSPSASSSPSVSPAPVLAFAPADGSTAVRPDQQVTVTAQGGSLSTVTVRSADGKHVVTGELDPDGRSWHSMTPLSGGTSYTVTAQSAGEGGATHTTTSAFTTLKPRSTMSVTLIPGDDWTVGVGMPVIVQFPYPVKNRAAAVKALQVTTSPQQLDGAWRWMNDRSVWWRPRDFWPSGTKVKVTAAVDGAELSPGVWGRRTYTAQFAIGSSLISTVDVKKHTLTLTEDGAVVRVLPVTTGKNDPRFRTRGGTKVIMEKLETVRMDAATTGTDAKDPEFYNTVEHWAMRLTWSGEYLHARPGSDWAFGKTNISHGCTGLSNANAKWLFDYSKIGDVVKYVGSSRPLEFGNGYTAWDLTFDQWSSGSGT